VSTIAGFNSYEDTEIPQLKEHAKKLTEAERIASCRQFLNGLLQLLNSMKLFADHRGEKLMLSADGIRAREKQLKKALSGLEKVRKLPSLPVDQTPLICTTTLT
jgi:hypothetical protein